MTNLKIGTDIIEINRVEKAIKSESFLKQIFTEKEIDLIKKRGSSTAAVNFAGKEAVVKAMGVGFKKISPKEIEILRKDTGEPFVEGRENIKISLSHCSEYAVAMVIIN